MSTEPRRSKRDAAVLSESAQSNSSESSGVYEDAHQCQQSQGAVQPADVKQVICFLTFTLKESVLQTIYTIQHTLKCTWLLIRELPKPYADSIRVLVPLWLTVFHAFFLVIFALFQRVSRDGLDQARQYLVKQQQRWTARHAPPAFQPLASRSTAVLSSAVPSAQSNTTLCQSPSNEKTVTR